MGNSLGAFRAIVAYSKNRTRHEARALGNLTLLVRQTHQGALGWKHLSRVAAGLRAYVTRCTLVVGHSDLAESGFCADVKLERKCDKNRAHLKREKIVARHSFKYKRRKKKKKRTACGCFL